MAKSTKTSKTKKKSKVASKGGKTTSEDIASKVLAGISRTSTTAKKKSKKSSKKTTKKKTQVRRPNDPTPTADGSDYSAKATNSKHNKVDHDLGSPTYVLDDTAVPSSKDWFSSDGTHHGDKKSDKERVSRFDVPDKLSKIVSSMNKSVYLPGGSETVRQAFNKTVEYYNRFKIPNPDLYGGRYVPYVFFVRPSCNIFKNKTTMQKALTDGSNEVFNYAQKFSPELLKELDGSVYNQGTDFMYSLSNAVSEFSTSDEYINSDTYGKNYSGYQIAYGKNDVESKTAGDIRIRFKETHDLHIYLLHRLWIEYISGCYRGVIKPRNTSIFTKTLDYAGAIYYIITDEDGESIVFWSKYYGVFPTTMPSSQFSWGEGNLITRDNVGSIDITYKYSFKSDYDPFILYREFNLNAHKKHPTSYLAIYDGDAGRLGQTWVRTPYISLDKSGSNGNPYQFKLRFTNDKPD